MPRRLKAAGLLLAVVAGGLAAVLLLTHHECPAAGLALSPAARNLARLKNRTALPRREDFDDRVTLAALLQPGDDRARWSEARAGTVEGYVVEVKKAGAEAANCFSPGRRDIHVHVAARPDAPARETVVLEVTPHLERWAARQGWDWSEAGLRRDLLGRWCYFEGWLLFDREHADEAANTAPGASDIWRATAWELHPLTRVRPVR